MSFHRFASVSFATIALVVSTVSSAFAQPQTIGTFRWQFLPYCNVVTLLAVQQENSIITLSGTDDQCGGSVVAAANGTAHLNPSGTVSVSLVVTRPDGIAISTTAEVTLATGSGPYKDDAGNSGTFQISPPAPAPGNPRRITLKGVYSAGFLANGLNNNQASQISFGKTLPVAPSAPLTNIIAFGSAPTTNCPGSVDDPRAAPGQLCLYERVNSNATYQVYNTAGVANLGDVIGAHILTRPVALGAVAMSGVWAVTIP